jgi:teichuronic acid biosynthesis glycosyltransferase TuaC
MKVISISTMFPSRALPVHAVFVKNRLKHVAERCELIVISPVPYFPFARLLSRYASRRNIPRTDVIDGLTVHYPRFLSIPAVLKPLDGVFLFLTVLLTALRLRKQFPFELIDAHLAFPDGFGAVLLGRLLGKPVTVTLRGHDVNDLPRFPVRSRQVSFTLRRAHRVIAVANALKDAAVALGADPETTERISNGVDGAIFFPRSREESRRKLSLPLDRRVILSVGHLVERKGFHIIVEAIDRLKAHGAPPLLVIAGAPGEEGDFRGEILAAISQRGLEEHVRMVGAKPNAELGDWYSAADVFCLASSKEGWANVLLEALACGTPVVATNVWGTPEVICRPEYGILVERTAESIAGGLAAALSKHWDRESIAQYARSQTWESVAQRVLSAFQKALEPRRKSSARAPAAVAAPPKAP